MNDDTKKKESEDEHISIYTWIFGTCFLIGSILSFFHIDYTLWLLTITTYIILQVIHKTILIIVWLRRRLG
jgi:hypothetical protein